jgi:hypothetical protein
MRRSFEPLKPTGTVVGEESGRASLDDVPNSNPIAALVLGTFPCGEVDGVQPFAGTGRSPRQAPLTSRPPSSGSHPQSSPIDSQSASKDFTDAIRGAPRVMQPTPQGIGGRPYTGRLGGAGAPPPILVPSRPSTTSGRDGRVAAQLTTPSQATAVNDPSPLGVSNRGTRPPTGATPRGIDAGALTTYATPGVELGALEPTMPRSLSEALITAALDAMFRDFQARLHEVEVELDKKYPGVPALVCSEADKNLLKAQTHFSELLKRIALTKVGNDDDDWSPEPQVKPPAAATATTTVLANDAEKGEIKDMPSGLTSFSTSEPLPGQPTVMEKPLVELPNLPVAETEDKEQNKRNSPRSPVSKPDGKRKKSRRGTRSPQQRETNSQSASPSLTPTADPALEADPSKSLQPVSGSDSTLPDATPRSPAAVESAPLVEPSGLRRKSKRPAAKPRKSKSAASSGKGLDQPTDFSDLVPTTSTLSPLIESGGSFSGPTPTTATTLASRSSLSLSSPSLSLQLLNPAVAPAGLKANSSRALLGGPLDLKSPLEASLPAPLGSEQAKPSVSSVAVAADVNTPTPGLTPLASFSAIPPRSPAGADALPVTPKQPTVPASTMATRRKTSLIATPFLNPAMVSDSSIASPQTVARSSKEGLSPNASTFLASQPLPPVTPSKVVLKKREELLAKKAELEGVIQRLADLITKHKVLRRDSNFMTGDDEHLDNELDVDFSSEADATGAENRSKSTGVGSTASGAKSPPFAPDDPLLDGEGLVSRDRPGAVTPPSSRLSISGAGSLGVVEPPPSAARRSLAPATPRPGENQVTPLSVLKPLSATFGDSARKSIPATEVRSRATDLLERVTDLPRRLQHMHSLRVNTTKRLRLKSEDVKTHIEKATTAAQRIKTSPPAVPSTPLLNPPGGVGAGSTDKKPADGTSSLLSRRPLLMVLASAMSGTAAAPTTTDDKAGLYEPALHKSAATHLGDLFIPPAPTFERLLQDYQNLRQETKESLAYLNSLETCCNTLLKKDTGSTLVTVPFEAVAEHLREEFNPPATDPSGSSAGQRRASVATRRTSSVFDDSMTSESGGLHEQSSLESTQTLVTPTITNIRLHQEKFKLLVERNMVENIVSIGAKASFRMNAKLAANLARTGKNGSVVALEEAEKTTAHEVALLTQAASKFNSVTDGPGARPGAGRAAAPAHRNSTTSMKESDRMLQLRQALLGGKDSKRSKSMAPTSFGSGKGAGLQAGGGAPDNDSGKRRDVAIQNTLSDEQYFERQTRASILFAKEEKVREALHQVQVALANVNFFFESTEVDLTCQRCWGIFKNPQIIATCGLSYCKGCIIPSDEGGTEGVRLPCGCLSHEGFLPNSQLETVLQKWRIEGHATILQQMDEELQGLLGIVGPYTPRSPPDGSAGTLSPSPLTSHTSMLTGGMLAKLRTKEAVVKGRESKQRLQHAGVFPGEPYR